MTARSLAAQSIRDEIGALLTGALLTGALLTGALLTVTARGNMGHAIILLESERTFTIPPATTLRQSERDAAAISPFGKIIPFVRVRKTPAPSFTSTSADVLVVSFATAAVLAYADESTQTGARFLLMSGSVTLPTSTDFPTDGATYSMPTPAAGLGALSNPGALILWQIANPSSSVTQTFTGDIYLICRDE